MARKPQKEKEQLYFGRQGIRLAGAIFTFLGVLVLAVTPFVIGRARVLLMALVAAVGLASRVLSPRHWRRERWALGAYAVWAAVAVCLQLLFQLATRMISWGAFALSEVVFVVILFQIGRYLDHDLRELAGEG